jgi:hypothetical protein
MPSIPLRVDVGGVAIYVRSEFECRHLTQINHQNAIAKLALHKIAAGHCDGLAEAARAIEDMKRSGYV